jgi:hypothetical protein
VCWGDGTDWTLDHVRPSVPYVAGASGSPKWSFNPWDSAAGHRASPGVSSA